MAAAGRDVMTPPAEDQAPQPVLMLQVVIHTALLVPRPTTTMSVPSLVNTDGPEIRWPPAATEAPVARSFSHTDPPVAV